MRNFLMMMLLAAEGEVETQTQAQPPAETSEPTQTAEEKADADALKHLEEAMKNKSGEGEGEQAERKVDDDSNQSPQQKPEDKLEDKKPEEKTGEDAKPNAAPETKPAEPAGETKPEDKKPDEDSLKRLEALLDSYLNGGEFGDEEMGELMKGLKALVADHKAMRSVQAELKAFVDDQNAQKLEAAIDEGFEALSDDLADVFGRGAGRKIEKAFMDNREKALEKVAVLKAGYDATGKDWTLQGLIREAALMLAPELINSVPRQRKREFIAQPQKSEGQQRTGEDAAFAEFERKYKDLKKE